MGGIFAFGWTPCLGPLLGSILLLAATSRTAVIGGLLLAIFSLGFAVPFLVVGYFLGSSTAYLKRIERYLTIFSIIGGIFLIILGCFMLFSNAAVFTSWVFGWLNFDTNWLLKYL
jgi:cytochrome c biogenesis protein CcdA